MKYWALLGIIALGVLSVLLLSFPSHVSATSGTLTVPGGTTGTVSPGQVQTGNTISYRWFAGERSQDIDFSIVSNAGTSYNTVTGASAGDGLFSVPEDDNYSMVWTFHSNVGSHQTSTIKYVYSVTPPETDFEVTHGLNDTQYLPEQACTVSIRVKNIFAEQLNISWIGISFDFYESGGYWLVDFISVPKFIAPGQSITFSDKTAFPAGISVSNHTYTIVIAYQKSNSGAYSDEWWESKPLSDLKIVDYSLTAYPQESTIAKKEGATIYVTLAGKNGFSKTVNLTATGLPSGASVSFLPPSLTKNQTCTMFINASSKAQEGTYSIVIHGTCGDQSIKTTSASVTIVPSSTVPGTNGAGAKTNIPLLVGIVVGSLVVALAAGVIFSKRRHKAAQRTSQVQYPPPYQAPPQQYIVHVQMPRSYGQPPEMSQPAQQQPAPQNPPRSDIPKYP